MKELIDMLHAGGYSCVIANGDRIRTFTRRGVADLYDLLVQEPEFLHGASVADKVIGKAAASLMVLGGVREVYTRTISRPALGLLQEAGIAVSCDEVVDHIINRDRTGWCPLEQASRDLHTPQEIFPVIEKFIARTAQWCVFFKDNLLMQKQADGTCILPTGNQLPVAPPEGQHIHRVTLPTGKQVYTFAVDYPVAETSEWMMTGLRASFDHLPLADYKAAGKAYQILYWDRHSRYCPACGTPTGQQTDIMKKCPQCGYELYPPISTAIIVLVRRGDEILLVHARNFRGTFFGLVAGFLEAGETLEQCVRREVMEETGLTIRNITYFDSQPWPYPSGLMVGFFADYESGTIKLQQDELSAGAFYHRNNLPELPRKLSIARRLIDAWLEGRDKP